MKDKHFDVIQSFFIDDKYYNNIIKLYVDDIVNNNEYNYNNQVIINGMYEDMIYYYMKKLGLVDYNDMYVIAMKVLICEIITGKTISNKTIQMYCNEIKQIIYNKMKIS